jgi:hypothetical protein
LLRLEEAGEDLTAEEREAAAKPTEAGEYWKEWDNYRVAERLFSYEVIRLDAGRDKKNKKSIGERTTVTRRWFSELSESRKNEVRNVANKWNSDGCPSKEKMFM